MSALRPAGVLALLVILCAPLVAAESPCRDPFESGKKFARALLGYTPNDFRRADALGTPTEMKPGDDADAYLYDLDESCKLVVIVMRDNITRSVALVTTQESEEFASTVHGEYLEVTPDDFVPVGEWAPPFQWGDVRVEWKREGRNNQAIFLWSGTGDRPNLPLTVEGIWERVGDTYAGMRVRVAYQRGEMVAVVTQRAAAGGSFDVGMTKWAGIESISDRRFTFDDLYTTGRRRASLLELDGDRLYTALIDGEGAAVGQAQTWVRVAY